MRAPRWEKVMSMTACILTRMQLIVLHDLVHVLLVEEQMLCMERWVDGSDKSGNWAKTSFFTLITLEGCSVRNNDFDWHSSFRSSYDDVLGPYEEETSFVYARGSPGLGDFPPRIRSELNQYNCDVNGIGQRKAETLYQALEPSTGLKVSHNNFKKNFVRSDPRELELQRHQDYTIAVWDT